VEAYGVKRPVLERPNYTIYFERTPYGDLFIHCDFFGKWTKATKKEFLEELFALLSLVGEPIYAMPYKQNKKMQKFLKMCRFKELTSVQAEEYKLAVYIWRG